MPITSAYAFPQCGDFGGAVDDDFDGAVDGLSGISCFFPPKKSTILSTKLLMLLACTPCNYKYQKAHAAVSG